MKLPHAMSFSGALPLPNFVLRPLTALVIAAVHVYLGFGHLSKLFGDPRGILVTCNPLYIKR